MPTKIYDSHVQFIVSMKKKLLKTVAEEVAEVLEIVKQEESDQD